MNPPSSPNPHRGLGTGMLVLTWVIIMGLVAAWFQGYLRSEHNPNSEIASQYTSDGRISVVLARNRAGHYVATGTIDGHPVDFLVDTGATQVALSETLAARLGLRRGPAMAIQTANGTARAFATRIDEIALGDIALRNIPATIVPGMHGNEALLGMSFLKHLDIEQRGGTLKLTPRNTAR